MASLAERNTRLCFTFRSRGRLSKHEAEAKLAQYEYHLWRPVLLILGACFLAMAGGPLASAGAQDDKRPNILFIIADDWSWGHAGGLRLQMDQDPGV